MPETPIVIGTINDSGQLIPLPPNHPQVQQIAAALDEYESPVSREAQHALRQAQIIEDYTRPWREIEDVRFRMLCQAVEQFIGLFIAVDIDHDTSRISVSLVDVNGQPFLTQRGHTDDAYGIAVKLLRTAGITMDAWWDF